MLHLAEGFQDSFTRAFCVHAIQPRSFMDYTCHNWSRHSSARLLVY